MSFQDTADSRDKVHNNETKKQHLVSCTMLVDNTVQNKISYLNVILDSGRNATTVNWNHYLGVLILRYSKNPLNIK